MDRAGQKQVAVFIENFPVLFVHQNFAVDGVERRKIGVAGRPGNGENQGQIQIPQGSQGSFLIMKSVMFGSPTGELNMEAKLLI